MERLQKKCLIASMGMHSLLVLILFIGPAFLSSAPKKAEDVPILDFIPDKLVDALVSGGGNPNARPPAPAPVITPAAPVVQPAPTPPPPQPKPEVKPVEPDPPKVRNKEPDSDSLEPAVDTKPKKPNISLKPIVRKDPSKTASKNAEKEAEDQQRREYAENQKRIAGLISKAAGNVLTGRASATTIEDSYGPGGGGPTYASYVAWVKTVYDQAWIAPEDSSKDDTDVVASVTIAQDGTIISAHIVTPSGDPLVDGSVRRVLARVKTIGKPFPEGAKEKERTYPIRFNVKAKRGTA